MTAPRKVYGVGFEFVYIYICIMFIFMSWARQLPGQLSAMEADA